MDAAADGGEERKQLAAAQSAMLQMQGQMQMVREHAAREAAAQDSRREATAASAHKQMRARALWRQVKETFKRVPVPESIEKSDMPKNGLRWDPVSGAWVAVGCPPRGCAMRTLVARAQHEVYALHCVRIDEYVHAHRRGGATRLLHSA